VNELFSRERTKTSRNVTISFSLTFKARPSPERATATRGWGPLVKNKFVTENEIGPRTWTDSLDKRPAQATEYGYEIRIMECNEFA
jgi:hypothetical protein